MSPDNRWRPGDLDPKPLRPQFDGSSRSLHAERSRIAGMSLYCETAQRFIFVFRPRPDVGTHRKPPKFPKPALVAPHRVGKDRPPEPAVKTPHTRRKNEARRIYLRASSLGRNAKERRCGDPRLSFQRHRGAHVE